eukprot:maker-scaffold108_size357748-snap-gene-2.16 protein:Tk09442 transcript:maker-scaffold108_size357748-snap-gene-2.16-mRNA-1 annotation:"tyw4_yarli ame: full"
MHAKRTATSRWNTILILKCLSRLDIWTKLSTASTDHIQLWAEYKLLRNRSTNAIRRDRRRHVQDIAEQHPKDTRMLWDLLWERMGKMDRFSLCLVFVFLVPLPGGLANDDDDYREDELWWKLNEHEEALEILSFEMSEMKKTCSVDVSFHKEEPKTILVLGPNDYNGPNVELVRINPRHARKSVYCKGIQKLKNMHGQLYGSYVNQTNTVIVCEGTFCVERDFKSDEEIRRFDAADFREYSSTVMIDPNTWWVTGGTLDLHGVLNSTRIFKDGEFHAGPDLPERKTGHCLIRVNETSYFMMGTANYYEHETTKLWLYSFPEAKWEPLPSLQSVRREPPMCGLISEKARDGTVINEVVIVDGEYPTEILNLNTLEWRRGPPLPVEFRYGTTIQYGNSFLILGGLVNEKASFRGLQKGELELKSILEYDIDTQKWLGKTRSQFMMFSLLLLEMLEVWFSAEFFILPCGLDSLGVSEELRLESELNWDEDPPR